MFNFIKNIFPKRCLGVDIGTSCIKVVEIKKAGKKKTLENYGQVSSVELYKGGSLFSTQETAKLLTAVMRETEIKADDVAFSIPDFSTFFTNLELPLMSKEELPQAVQYEARRYIPLPISEVTLDWQIIKNGENKKNQKILLMAVPNEIVTKYKEVAEFSKLKIVSLEAEAFSLVRALTKEGDKDVIALIDIGSKSTVCSIVDGTTLKRSYSLNLSGSAFSLAIKKKLEVSLKEADRLKKQHGIINRSSKKRDISTREILIPLIDQALEEIKKVLESFHKEEEKEVEKIIIVGGSSLTPGLKEYLEKSLNKKVELGNAFSGITYPPILKETMSKMNPEFAAAVGSALRGLEY
jgi:type IV pilus assembly protein PilM